MSDLKMISPLLDGMAVEKEITGHNGRSCYTLRRIATGERFLLRRKTIPVSESQVSALIISGAYPDEAAVNEYYAGVVEGMKSELNAGKKLTASGCFAGAVDYQIERKDSGVGYDIYILYPHGISLREVMDKGAMTNLRAVNLGIDICDALSACREGGYIFGNLTPDNIFLLHNGRFLLGGLGLVGLEDLQYACLPEEYIGGYSAPELSDIAATVHPTIDLYSLGMVLHRIYNGNHSPFEDEETGEAMADKLRMTGKPLPTPLYADYELAAIILRACAFKPEERYQTPEEMKQALMLYMQRNEIADTLLVPPIIAPETPVTAEEEPSEAEESPARMTDAEALDEDFRKSFAPDRTGAGTEKDVDVAASAPAAEAPVPEASAEGEPSAPVTPEGEQSDPDQIDIDELLASVNEVVGRTPPADESAAQNGEMTIKVENAPAADRYVDVHTQEEEAAPKRSIGAVVGKIAAIILLLAAIGAVGYFLLNWYFVDVNKLELSSCTTEQAVIALSSEDDWSRFVLSCTDNYGNAYPVTGENGVYSITGLQEKTIYTVTVSAAEYHRLTSASTYTLNFTTPEATRVTEFTATRGEADGEVQLSLLFEGPAPEEWILSSVNATGENAAEYRFTGNSYLVTGLTQNEIYTFTLGTVEGYYPSGALTLEYEVLPIVEARKLNISAIDAHEVTISWEPGENLPEEWTVTCEADGMETITRTTRQTSCVLELEQLDRDYTISVIARGMDKAESLSLPANPIVVDGLKAETTEDGAVIITWNTPAGKPSGGWYVSYNTEGSYHSPYFANDGQSTGEDNAVILSRLIPDATYEVALTLTAENAEDKVFGTTTLTFTTDQAGVFESYSLSPDAPLDAENGNIQLYTLPELDEWDYTDLDDDDQKDTFAKDEKIAVCIEVNSVRSSRDEVTLTYVIRDSKGKVVNDVSKVLAWSDMWYSRRHASAIPLPGKSGENSTAGSYTLEVYVNGQLLASAGFTIA